MPIPCAVLMCHAPIVVPEIAGVRAAECARTTRAMEAAAARLVRHEPEAIAIISPHAPRDRSRFGICADPLLTGDFRQFGAPDVEVRVPGAPALAGALHAAARKHGISTRELAGDRLDHGALVPLYFLRKAGWRGPTLLIALPYYSSGAEPALGRALAEAAAELGQRLCVLASGDMSHRLTPDAPAGYHPQAREFDARFRELIARGELQSALQIDATLRELAAEDVVDSCAVAAGAVGFDASGGEVLSYEGPFGVGYLEAILHESGVAAGTGLDGGDESAAPPPSELLSIARSAIASHLCGQGYPPPQLAPPWRRSRGVFVTLRTPTGELRGCVGHMEPVCPTLSQEVAACAVASATRDTRFVPVTQSELADLRIEISLLSEPESVASIAELDPNRYGVVVSAGERRGVLLPSIDGIDNAHEQVRIAALKAGLSAVEPLELQRFEIVKLQERAVDHARGLGWLAARLKGRHELN